MRRNRLVGFALSGAASTSHKLTNKRRSGSVVRRTKAALPAWHYVLRCRKSSRRRGLGDRSITAMRAGPSRYRVRANQGVSRPLRHWRHCPVLPAAQPDAPRHRGRNTQNICSNISTVVSLYLHAACRS